MTSKVTPNNDAETVSDSHEVVPKPQTNATTTHETSDARFGSSKLLRRSSNMIKEFFDNRTNNELQLDLEKYYHASARRRTQLGDEISDHIAKVTTPPSANDLNDTTGVKAKSRGIMMTLSPGEEYENYQKVDAAINLQSSLDDEDDDDATDLEHEEEVKANTIQNAEESQFKRKEAHTSVVVPSVQPRADGTLVPSADRKSVISSTTSSSHRLVKQPSLRPQPMAPIRSKQMVNPRGRFRLTWDIISILFIFYNAIVIPFQASFNNYVKQNTPFETIIDVFFIVDILVTFNTAIEHDGSIQYSRRLAAKAYIRTWFLIDLIASIPVELAAPDNAFSESTFRRLKLLRLIRLLRLLRISRIARRIQNTVFIRSTMGALLKYCLMVMFVAHWFSCIFHTIAMNHSSGINWVKVANLQDPIGNKWDRYVAALYFAVMTLATIGYGDVSGTNADERLFSIAAMIIGGGIFAYGITNIVELVSSLTIQETRFRQRMDEVNEYMNARELPIKLRMEIREFYHNTRLSRESKLNAEQNILNDLSSKLRSKIALSINDQFLRKFPFFTGSEPNFLLELALNMRMIHFAPLEDVIIEGEIGHEMFFIFRGAVEIIHEGKQIGILGENQYFGEMAILSPDNRRRATVRTLCFCELRMLSRNRFLEALAQFPSMQTKMSLVAQSRQSPQKVEPIIENLDLNEKLSLDSSIKLKPMDTSISLQVPVIPLARSQSRLQQADQRTHLPYVNARPTTGSTRLSSSSRRGSNSASSNISSSIASQLSETTARLEELSRRQEVSMNRILKLQTQLSQLKQ